MLAAVVVVAEYFVECCSVGTVGSKMNSEGILLLFLVSRLDHWSGSTAAGQQTSKKIGSMMIAVALTLTV